MCFWFFKGGAKSLSLWLVFVKTITKTCRATSQALLSKSRKARKKTACHTVQPYWNLLTVWDFWKIKKRWNSSKIVVHRCFSTQRMLTIIPKYHGGPMSHCTLLDLCPTVRQLQIFDVNIWWCHHILKWSYICSENGTGW